MTDTSKLKYTPTHEWVDLKGRIATVGITDHAQKEISDVVFVELPKAGRELRQKDGAMVIESVKAAFDIYAPLSGKVIEVNSLLKDRPEVVNRSPYAEGWPFKMEISDESQAASLLSEVQYNEIKTAAH